ncbi:MAG: 3'-5' exonuclease [Myxococcales bacterium]|nr:3'-5' exonuclease [Myxococcales bacterium]
MLDRPIAAFDIETIPDPSVGRRIMGLSGDDAEIVRAMVQARLEQTDGLKEYPTLPHQRIVMIGLAWLDPESGRFKLGMSGGEGFDEREHLEGFFKLFRARRPPRLVSWNGGGFDLPVIRYRSMLHGVSAPELYQQTGEWKWNNYQNRFHDMHLDLMDVLSGYGASTRVGLGTISPLLGLAGKSFLERPIYEHILRDEAPLVREYCKMDVLETLLLYLSWAHHCGKLGEEALLQHVETIRAALALEPYEGWKGIVARLASWPPWAQPRGEGGKAIGSGPSEVEPSDP